MRISERYAGKRFSISEYRALHREIFDGLRQGMSTDSIAAQNGISARRVRRILERGGVSRVTYFEWVGTRTTFIPVRRHKKRILVVTHPKSHNS